MNRILNCVLLLITINLFGQDNTELNKKSKELIHSNQFKKAIPILNKLSKKGIAEAQYNLGVCLEFGYGIKKNINEAHTWYQQSAESGWNDALYKMMMAHANGKGATKDYSKAFKYAVECAKNKDITCMFNVVSAYKDGLGTEKNHEKLLEWAIKIGKLEAPENLLKSGKVTSARLNLAYMYRDGNNVKINKLISYSWFLIYNESKRDFSVIRQENVISEIKNLGKTLTNEELIEAKNKAEKILERPLKNFKNLHKTSR